MKLVAKMKTSPQAANKLATLPGIHVLTRTIRYVQGGRKTFLEFVQLAMQEGNGPAGEFWNIFMDLTPHERNKVSLDDVCWAAGVQPSDLMGSIVTVAMEFGRDMGNFVAAAMHPQVVRKHIDSALDINGANPEISLKDRHAFLQANKFLPTPKGTGVVINNATSANSQAAAAASAEPTVPSFSDDMRDISRGVLPARLVEDEDGVGPMFEAEREAG